MNSPFRSRQGFLARSGFAIAILAAVAAMPARATHPEYPTLSVAADRSDNVSSLPFGHDLPDSDLAYFQATDNLAAAACAGPPRGLKAWWPLDEGAGGRATELAQHANGTWFDNPLPIAGKFGRALAFDGVASHVAVSNQAAVDFATGDLSIDFWIRTLQSTGSQTLLGKRAMLPETVGWVVYLYEGQLVFQLAEGGTSACDDSTALGCTNYESGVFVADGAWNFVAITVDRDQPDGLRFYVNGVAAPAQDPTLRQDTLSNTNPLYFGRYANDLPNHAFTGALDEVELFDRALSEAEVLALQNAPSGKCKSALQAEWAISQCTNVDVVNARPRLCNDSSENTSFGLQFSSVPAGDYPQGVCTIDGPTVFDLAEATPILVAAGTCVDLHVEIAEPAGMAPGQIACFDLQAEDLGTGQLHLARSSFYDSGGLCAFPQGGTSSAVPFNQQAAFTFDVVNVTTEPRTFNFEFTSRSSDGGPSAVFLSGGLAGNTVSGQLDVPAQSTAPLSVDVGIEEFLPFTRQDLLLHDRDANVVVSSRGLRSFIPGCLADAANLCLNQNRFQINVVWRDFIGQTGAGHAGTLTSDTGYFWFFSPDNIEVVVKVLDGRELNQRWWVFFGALSSVEYTVTVRDTYTGESKSYYNPSGVLASVADTSALPGYTSSFAASLASDLIRHHLAGQAAGPEAPADQPLITGNCEESGTALCLQDARFRVEVEWTTAAGLEGVGQATRLTSGTGYFWFFNADNVELVIKVLDGRGINGHWWVFYGALSDVEYTITVTDTDTGAVRTYHNALYNLASIADTTAFPE